MLFTSSSNLFIVDASTHNVSAVEALQVGRYDFSIIVIVGPSLFTGYALVEVTAQREFLYLFVHAIMFE